MSKVTADRRSIFQAHFHRPSVILIGLVALVHALHYTEAVLVPILFALLLAMLLNPVVNFMIRKRVPRILAITLSVVLAMAALGGLAYFIVTQAAQFGETLPQFKEKLGTLRSDGHSWLQQTFNLRSTQVTDAVQKVKEEGLQKGGSYVGETLTAMGTLFGFFFLLPVFAFLLLLYKGLLVNFIFKLFPIQQQQAVTDVLGQTKGVVQSYLVGLIFEAGIVAALNWAGLLIIGLEYALLFAVLGALLNLIPYIGMITATLLPMVFAFATMDTMAAFWVLVLYIGVQFLDNNIIVPRVVASRVQLNALVSIIGVLFGGLLWGIPGMFLSLPLIAMLKVVFDRVPGLEPIGYVLGEEAGKERRSAKVRPAQSHLSGSGM
jgi:predicted PurR-regulated permease PerM